MKRVPARLWMLAALSGTLQVLCFPIAGPLPLWRTGIAWVALIPLLHAILKNDRLKTPPDVLQSAFLGYLCGFIFYLGNCSWIFETMNRYGGLPEPVAGGVLALFCLYLGLYHSLFAALLAWIRIHLGSGRALLLVPFLWVAGELARARITGFPWDLLGVSQIDHPLPTSLAPWTGAYGISFAIAAANALWLVRIRLRARPLLRPALALGVAFLCGLYLFALHRAAGKLIDHATATATLLQENLEVGAANQGPPESVSAMLDTFSYLSRNPAHRELNGIPEASTTRMLSVNEFPYVAEPGVEGYRPANLIVWPESPAGFRTNDPSFQSATGALARSAHAPLVIGSLGVILDPAAARGGFLYDSAALLNRDGTPAGRYDKIHLVPFGEYVPFKNMFFFARKLTAGVGDMDRGRERTVFRTRTADGVHAFGVFVCYESIFGDEVRQFVRNGAEVLVNISDDGWYGDSGAPWQHLNMVRMRAIENHRWVLRSTNTGITGVIDPSGHVLAALPRHMRASINVPFGFERNTTFYTRHGDLFAYLCSFVSVLALASGARARVN